jgi:Holliday junction resolvasome RuvABC DNA-binding subunit
MTRKQAKQIIGNQPKWALKNMARALQMLSLLNTPAEWERLRALKALGYKVTVIKDARKELNHANRT